MEKKITEYYDEIREISGIIKGIDLMESMEYIKYRKTGNNEAAKEIILDKAGEINAIFAKICEKIEKS